MYKNIEDLKSELNTKKSIKFRIKVSANSREDSIDFCDDLIKIKVRSPAIEGKANKAIVEFISKMMDVAKSRVKILNGEKSSIKTIFIQL